MVFFGVFWCFLGFLGGYELEIVEENKHMRVKRGGADFFQKSWRQKVAEDALATFCRAGFLKIKKNEIKNVLVFPVPK